MKTESDKQVGIDLGLMHYTADSDGLYLEHPGNIKRAERRLTREQGWLSRKKKRSRNRAKQRRRVAGVHERVVNRRRDFLHKLSRYYVDNYGFIAVEDLDCKEMMMSARNAKNHADSSWSTFINMLEYKAGRAGAQLVKVDPRGTSQDCSCCGAHVQKGLWERIHRCPVCGFEVDRDYNASVNILKRALTSVGQGLPEYTPAETGPPPERHVPASLVVEAGSPLR
jgi:putative transposase